jgi:uncharacterized protein involved in exopolysaccharide biosynthesis
MEYVPVPKTENQSAQSSEKHTDSTFSPEASQLSQQLVSQSISGEQIELAELWRAIFSSKLTIIFISLIFAAASIAFALSKPDIYKASVLLSPASSEGGGMGGLAGQFGGLASIAGINLGGGSADKTALALEIIKSRAFLEKFIAKHELLVPLIASKKWDRINDSLIIDDEIYDVVSKKWVREVSFPKTVKPSPWEAYQKLLQLITTSQDKITSLVTIDVEFYSPEMAKKWLSWLVADVNDSMRAKDESESQASIDYLTEQLKKTEVSAMETVFYQLIEEQTKNMMLTKISEEYVLKIIDPAQVPDEKSGPKRAMTVVLGTMLGGMLAVFFVLVRYFFNKKTES